MADIKISQLTAKGTAIASTDLVEISQSDGAGGYVTKSVTGANIIGSKQDTLVSGTNIKTINSNSILGSGDLVITGGGTQIGALIGGGVVVAVYNENGVNKALVASLTNLGNVPYTIPAFQSTLIGATAQSYYDGLTNTNAIIAQTGAAATTAYAAGLARLFAGGGFSDWYLPSVYELQILFNSAAFISRAAGVSAFDTAISYFSSTEITATQCGAVSFSTGNTSVTYGKGFGGLVRAVRIHTI